MEIRTLIASPNLISRGAWLPGEIAGKTPLAFVVAIIISVLASLPAMCGSAVFDEAVQSYKQGKYADAVSKLESLKQPEASTESVHYYKGLCYQGLNQIARAQQEYSWVYYYGKDNTLRYNAHTALAQLSRYQQNRTYQGQGNNFARVSDGPAYAPPTATEQTAPT